MLSLSLAPLVPVPTTWSRATPSAAERPIIPVDGPDAQALLDTVRAEDGSIAWAGAGSWSRPAGACPSPPSW